MNIHAKFGDVIKNTSMFHDAGDVYIFHLIYGGSKGGGSELS